MCTKLKNIKGNEGFNLKKFKRSRSSHVWLPWHLPKKYNLCLFCANTYELSRVQPF